MKPASRLALAGAALLFLLFAIYAYAYYYRFPYLDHLDLCIYIDLYYQGNLTLSSLFLPHGNAHWHAPTYFLLIPLAIGSRWNLVWDITINLVVVLLTWLAIRALIRHTAARIGQPSLVPWGTLATAWFLFSVNQAANSLWGWQMAVFLNLLGSLGGIVLLSRPRLRIWHVVGAALGGALATYDFSTGLAFWPIGLVLIVLHGRAGPRRKIWLGGVFILCAAAVIYHYYDSIYLLAAKVGPIAHDQERSILNKARFALIYLGTPVAWLGDVQTIPTLPVEDVRFLRATKIIAVTGLLLLIGLAGYLNRRHRMSWTVLAPVLAIGAYAVGSAVLTSFARITSGPEQAGTPRYTSVSNLLWISVFLLALITLPRLSARPKRMLTVALLALTVLMTATTLRIARAHAENAIRHNSLGAQIAVMYPNIDDRTLLRVFPDLGRIRGFLRVMSERKLNLFRDPPSYASSVPLDIGGAELKGISLLGGSSRGVRFHGHGPNPHLIVTLHDPLPEAFVISLKVRFPDGVKGELQWSDDGREPFGPGYALTRVGLDEAYWFDVRPSRSSGPTRALKLGFKPVRGATCDFEGTFQELKAWIR